VDLHLREDAACGQCRAPHVHICHREGLANQARVKIKLDWYVQDGVVHGGAIRRASPAMVNTYFEYMTTEYPENAEQHGMVLVNLRGPGAGQPWSAEIDRRMLRRAGVRPQAPPSGSTTHPVRGRIKPTRPPALFDSLDRSEE
jgi:hypothetical protein